MKFKLMRSICIWDNDLGYDIGLCSIFSKIFVTISSVGLSIDDNLLWIQKSYRTFEIWLNFMKSGYMNTCNKFCLCNCKNNLEYVYILERGKNGEVVTRSNGEPL
jgi:hypothetical protein